MRKAGVMAAGMMLGVLSLTNLVWAAGAHWGYEGKEGPERWGKLDPEFSTCADGRNQSPIDLTAMVEGELPDIDIRYQPGGEAVVNNGHTVQVNYAPGSTILVDGHRFELKQFHFHSPSENTIDGRSFPLEAHFVHADAEGNLAVIAVLFQEGKENTALKSAWRKMPSHAGEPVPLAQQMDAAALLPEDRDYYRFNGSLTTPPCSEGVWWLVMKSRVSASKAQIAKFSQAMGHPNNRPVQPLNARMIVQ